MLYKSVADPIPPVSGGGGGGTTPPVTPPPTTTGGEVDSSETTLETTPEVVVEAIKNATSFDQLTVEVKAAAAEVSVPNL